MKSNNDFYHDGIMWFDYASKTAPSFQLRSLLELLKNYYDDGNLSHMEEYLSKKDMGSEIIFTLRKI